MSRKPSPSLIAHKAINLAGDLTASEKRVAAVLIDCYNFQTGQCDPGLNTLAKLLKISRRTVIRATGALMKKGYFRKLRHGGYFHRNSYEPIWSRFQLNELAWAAHRKSSRYKKPASNVSPLTGQTWHVDGDAPDTETFPCNNLPETSVEGANLDADAAAGVKHLNANMESPKSVDGCVNSVTVEGCFAVSRAVSDAIRKQVAKGAASFEKRLQPHELKAWFSKVEVAEIANGCLVLMAPSKFVRSRIERDYVPQMEESFCPMIDGVKHIKIVVRR